MIRLCRIDADSEAPPGGLDKIAAAGSLDVLQLDYARPRVTPASFADSAPPELPELPRGFQGAVQSLTRTLFLEPEFRIITSAGWSNGFACAEIAGRTLIEAGCPDVPVSAVRGSNLMGILDYLLLDGLKLDHADSGAPWATLRDPVLAADLELGAGPIETALAEGGRVVIAGCYDGAAPAIAAGVREFGWMWSQRDALGAAAAAARAAIWPHQHACDSFMATGGLAAAQLHPRIELEHDGTFTVDLSHPVDDADCRRLRAWLQAGKPRDPSHLHADVRFDAASAQVTSTGPTQLRVAGCLGVKTDDRWRLEVLYQAGFLADAMLEFAHGAAATRRQVAEAFRSHFVDADDEHSLVTVQELAPADGDGGGASWLHLACRSKARGPCTEFTDHVGRFVNSNPTMVRLPAGRPQVQVECGLWPTRVPRSAIDVAVDTRPAREWV